MKSRKKGEKKAFNKNQRQKRKIILFSIFFSFISGWHQLNHMVDKDEMCQALPDSEKVKDDKLLEYKKRAEQQKFLLNRERNLELINHNATEKQLREQAEE